jgi:hypothetical protein
MITFLGIIFFLLAILLFASKVIPTGYDKDGNNLHLDDLIGSKVYRMRWLFLILTFVAMMGNPFSVNDAGERQVVQTFGGDLYTKFSPGFYYSGFFSKVTTYPNNVTLQISPKDHRSPEADYWMAEHPGTFSEGDAAQLSHTVKWDLPLDEPTMLKLHNTYGNISNLATTTLMQYQRQTASYSCQRLSSEDHYSGGQSQLNEYFQDQLSLGQVLLVTKTKSRTQTDGTSKTYIEVEPRVDSLGRVLRNKKSIKDINDIGMRPSFASIDNVQYDNQIYIKLQTKIKFAADEANSKQELVAAQQKEMTAEVKGREQIAQVKATEEAEEQREVIQARKAKLVAKEQAEQAKYTADKIEQEGRAQAAANRALVAAGLTPEQKMELQIKIAEVTSANIAKASTPQVVIMGGSDGNSSDLMKVFGAERALELIAKMNGGK